MAWGNAARSVAQEAEDSQVLLHFAGHIFEPQLSGALFWRDESMLLVADAPPHDDLHRNRAGAPLHHPSQ